jgi:HEAT repeat protein
MYMDQIDSLIADLQNPDRLIRQNAVLSLKKLGDAAQKAILALKQVMADTSEPFLQITAAGAISSIAPEDPSPTPVLVAGLKDSEGLHRAAAVEFLGKRRSKTAVLNAMTLLSDEDFLVRFATAKAVGWTFGNWFHAVAVCVAMLKDENPTYRAMGAECLLSIRRYVGDHLDLLAMAMSDAPWEARIDIEEVLAALKKQ